MAPAFWQLLDFGLQPAWTSDSLGMQFGGAYLGWMQGLTT